ncbi:hypothetical protein [Actinokineospora terrae]|uniref:DUF3800 domain-containing protein n=1 Tax=Actinokineospora terrae TaxID=155974 RepID=A0A1H9VZ48_9PSEU|nr:hypothetical protein [Actinokineospora terrae]SES27020.1 hypothetical protein SAMN04487818_109217 [Actinokineospora terrae]
MTLHAFVDESRRNDQYLIAAAVIDPRNLRPLRKLLTGMLMPGQRELHFKKETPTRRKAIISQLAGAEAAVFVYISSCKRGEERARRQSLAQLVDNLVDLQVSRLVLDSREVRDADDKLVIRRVLGERSADTALVYEHLDSTQDALMWIADAAAWCYGAGGDWQRRIGPLLTKVVDLRDVH